MAKEASDGLVLTSSSTWCICLRNFSSCSYPSIGPLGTSTRCNCGQRPRSDLGTPPLALRPGSPPPSRPRGSTGVGEGPHGIRRLQKRRPLHLGYHTRHEVGVELHRVDADLGGLRGGGVLLGTGAWFPHSAQETGARLPPADTWRRSGKPRGPTPRTCELSRLWVSSFMSPQRVRRKPEPEGGRKSAASLPGPLHSRPIGRLGGAELANMLELLVLAGVEVFEELGRITRSYRKRPGGRWLRRRPSGFL